MITRDLADCWNFCFDWPDLQRRFLLLSLPLVLSFFTCFIMSADGFAQSRRQALSLRGGARIPFGPVLSIGETGSVMVLYAGVCASLMRLRKLRPNADALMLGSESPWR